MLRHDFSKETDVRAFGFLASFSINDAKNKVLTKTKHYFFTKKKNQKFSTITYVEIIYGTKHCKIFYSQIRRKGKSRPPRKLKEIRQFWTSN
uniref:Bm227 n=1 Tax=Brugia malayi TaxID=6279 RepID=A0A1I9G0A5_BRUMA|nr:Bm227 [Brugia malayi]